ncbi:sensor domain-containing diguanylate cyclase [Salidesulfovibrio onnuriiensis]|uniref:sensor domain-containing diguanylate cyclase n=1 Tax=Salidesulfovibrio onnuriiensis TaxID=2583823 RepID=UPI0011C77FC9|nr:diguanylate cyclase [Salidesulfovibrio onnuriiensis]
MKSKGLFRWREPILVALFLAAVFLVAIKGMNVIETKTRAATAKTLRTVVSTVEESMQLWADMRLEDARALAASPGVMPLAKQLLALPREPSVLIRRDGIQDRLRNEVRDVLESQGYLGIFIIAPDYVSVASMRNVNIGTRNLIADQRLDLLKRVFAGESLIIPTIISDVRLGTVSRKPRLKIPTMFAATPLRDENGAIIAAFTIRLDPLLDFSRLMRLGRIGESGETYVFDSKGILLSESRFDDQLRTLGLLDAGEQSILHVRSGDPGVDMTLGLQPLLAEQDRPLTLMAETAITGTDGVNTEGYRDYRGVPVFGAWIWLENLEVGMCTQIDVSEAMQPYVTARNVILGGLGATAATSLLLTFFLVFTREKGMRRLKHYQAVLETQVRERTESLMQLNERLQEQVVERVRAEERLRNAQAELERSYEELEKVATTDALTGIANRGTFDQGLQQEWKRCMRQGADISLLMIDIDYFKLFNDTYGHQGGDACLQKVAGILGQHDFAQRPGDMVARYGGEEFVMLLSGAGLDHAETIAERFRNAVLHAAIPHSASKVQGMEVVTVSIGIASLVPVMGMSADALIKHADEALYEAKRQGRNQVAVDRG